MPGYKPKSAHQDFRVQTTLTGRDGRLLKRVARDDGKSVAEYVRDLVLKAIRKIK